MNECDRWWHFYCIFKTIGQSDKFRICYYYLSSLICCMYYFWLIFSIRKEFAKRQQIQMQSHTQSNGMEMSKLINQSNSINVLWKWKLPKTCHSIARHIHIHMRHTPKMHGFDLVKSTYKTRIVILISSLKMRSFECCYIAFGVLIGWPGFKFLLFLCLFSLLLFSLAICFCLAEKRF